MGTTKGDVFLYDLSHDAWNLGRDESSRGSLRSETIHRLCELSSHVVMSLRVKRQRLARINRHVVQSPIIVKLEIGRPHPTPLA